MSFLGRLHQVRAEFAERTADPWRKKLEDAVCGQEAVSTSTLLELLGVSKTTANARRIAKNMRSMGFIPIKSRRLMPGGFRDTVARGWARPIRETGKPTPITLLTRNQEGLR
jgi:hypothetical protein